VTDEEVARASREWAELERRESAYRTVILVDDGLATGSTMRAAALAAPRPGARGIVVAVPVASADACTELGDVADEIHWEPPEPVDEQSPGDAAGPTRSPPGITAPIGEAIRRKTPGPGRWAAERGLLRPPSPTRLGTTTSHLTGAAPDRRPRGPGPPG
jgi:putative phosphoribosyl transferase